MAGSENDEKKVFFRVIRVMCHNEGEEKPFDVEGREGSAIEKKRTEKRTEPIGNKTYRDIVAGRRNRA